MAGLTARTMAQQLGPTIETATTPFQYALSTRAGCECVSHALQAICELGEDATVTSIDGISAYDTISRRAMIAGLERVPGAIAASRFVRLFYAEGVVRTIHQGEGGEQGDPLMPLLFSVGQHDALSAIHEGMRVHERLFAYLDDIWLVSKQDRVGDLHNSAERELWDRARIRIHSGKTHVWNRSGRKQPACDELKRRAEMLDEEARVWMKKLVCGQGQRFFPSNRASRCWGALWVTWISCVRSWRPPPRNTVRCFKRSRACPTSSQHGCCCSIALRHEKTTNSGC